MPEIKDVAAILGGSSAVALAFVLGKFMLSWTQMLLSEQKELRGDLRGRVVDLEKENAVLRNDMEAFRRAEQECLRREEQLRTRVESLERRLSGLGGY